MIEYLSLKKITALHGQEIQQAVADVVNSGWYLHGEATERFEHDYAAFIGTRHCVSCGNGYDALWLMLKAYKTLGRLHDGDKIMVPANTFIATILAITDNGLKPVLVEPDKETLEIDDMQLEGALTSCTRALMIVHLYGRCAFTSRIADFCQRHHLLLFEDNAQAHGCRFGDKRTGSLGDAAAHSFYPGKNLGALGDAGAVTTDDEEVAQTVRSLGNYGSSRKYVFPLHGRNSRMDELQAAVLDIKLRYLDADNMLRKTLAARYEALITNPRVRMTADNGRDNVCHILPVFCEQRDALRDYLEQHGIQTNIHYPIPPHKQDCYAELHHLSLPITEHLSQTELSIPCNQTMTEEEAETVARIINSFGR